MENIFILILRHKKLRVITLESIEEQFWVFKDREAVDTWLHNNGFVYGHCDGFANVPGSEEVVKIICEIDVVRRVGGAYAMLISNSGLKSAIYVVYEVLVDKFDDENLYRQSAYFMLRAIMRMHSEEVKG